MDATFVRSARARYGAALVVLAVIALEVALGGRAIDLFSQKAVQAHASSIGRLAFR